MKTKMKNTFLATLIALPLATGLSGCVTTSDMNNLRQELRQTRTQLSKQIESVDAQSKEKDKLLEKNIKSSSSPMQLRQADMYAEVNAMKMQVAKLQGTVDGMSETVARIESGDGNSTVSLNELAAKVENMRLALESQLAIDLGLIKATAPDNSAIQKEISQDAAAVGGISAVVTSEAPKAAPADAAKALYDKALNLFQKRKYEEAIRDWSEFSKTFPKHKLVPNAIFWEGECYYQLKDYANAALKYQVVIANHSKSNKYRSSLLKQGLCLIKLGKTKSGRYILEDLIKKAPKSAEASRARTILKNIK